MAALQWTTKKSFGGKETKGTILTWMNQVLSSGGHDDVVTDLASDIADGITLVKLVQVLAKDGFPKHSPAPIMRANKLENLQICLKFLQEHNVPLYSVQAEDLLAGKEESALLLCKALKVHFTSDGNNKVHRANRYVTIEREDVRIFSWIRELLGKDVQSYTQLYDGKIVCEVVNVLHEGAVSSTELQNSTDGVAKLKLAEAASEKYLFIHSPFDCGEVKSGLQDSKLRSFLQQCMKIHQQRAHRRGADPARERFSGGGGGREAREAAHITARSYDAIQKKKNERENNPSLPATSPAKKYPDLYVQGASSYTDLLSRREEHVQMIRGSGRTASMTRHSFSSSESLDENTFTSFGGAGTLERVQSMESGISSQQQQQASWRSGGMEQATAPLPRSSSQGTLPPFPKSLPPARPGLTRSLARSTESFHTQTFGLASARRTPSSVHLSTAASGEEGAGQVTALEERVGVLASRFLYERQDMFKQILRALVKERKKRQQAEVRIDALEKSSRQLVQHYDSRLIELAKEVATLRNELAVQSGRPAFTTVTMEIEQLKEQTVPDHLSTPSVTTTHKNMLFLRKREGPEGADSAAARSPAASGVVTAYSKGPASSYKKLSRFFGEAPPRVEDLESLLEELGYLHLLPKLQAHDIGLVELHSLTEDHLEGIGIPLGIRVRLLDEARKLQPIELKLK